MDSWTKILGEPLKDDNEVALKSVYEQLSQMEVQAKGVKYSEEIMARAFGTKVFEQCVDLMGVPRKCLKELAEILFRELRKHHSATIFFHGYVLSRGLFKEKKEDILYTWLGTLADKSAESKREWQVQEGAAEPKAAKDFSSVLIDLCLCHQEEVSPRFVDRTIKMIADKLGKNGMIHYLNEYREASKSSQTNKVVYEGGTGDVVGHIIKRIEHPELKFRIRSGEPEKRHLQVVCKDRD